MKLLSLHEAGIGDLPDKDKFGGIMFRCTAFVLSFDDRKTVHNHFVALLQNPKHPRNFNFELKETWIEEDDGED